jgi:hypothetical protein
MHNRCQRDPGVLTKIDHILLYAPFPGQVRSIQPIKVYAIAVYEFVEMRIAASLKRYKTRHTWLVLKANKRNRNGIGANSAY